METLVSDKSQPDDLASLFSGGQPQSEADRLISQAHLSHLEGDLDQAARLFCQAIALGRDEPGLLLDLSKVLVAQKRHGEAVERLRQALAGSPDHLQARSIHLALSRAYEAMGQDQLARQHYRAFQDALTSL